MNFLNASLCSTFSGRHDLLNASLCSTFSGQHDLLNASLCSTFSGGHGLFNVGVPHLSDWYAFGIPFPVLKFTLLVVDGVGRR